MQENEMTETQDGQAQATETTAPAETKMEKFERERLSRRAALRKMGVTTAMSIFALFSVDDLAHMVGKAIEQHAGDSKIADQIAREFREVGIAMASGPGCGCQPSCGCGGCVGAAELCQCGCLTSYNDCAGTPPAGCANGANPFSPTCIAYNYNVSFNCDPQRTTCQQNCPS